MGEAAPREPVLLALGDGAEIARAEEGTELVADAPARGRHVDTEEAREADLFGDPEFGSSC